MLSYRHAFHAGNHADVLKHYVLSLVLDYMNQKDKPYWYIDTHAGAGMYALDSDFAQKNAEFETGIARLIGAKSLPATLANYVDLIKKYNQNNQLQIYPGSPAIARHYLRADDKIRLFELHPNDYKFLMEAFKYQGRQTKIEMQNGFIGLKACLPPPCKRAVVLIDPPYELKDDYRRVADCIKDGLSRFASGTYMVWYPLLQRPEPMQMLEKLKQLNMNNWLNVSLSIQAPSAEGFGMYGSGMFIVNPPWTLPATLNESMPALTKLLAMDETAHFELTSQMT